MEKVIAVVVTHNRLSLLTECISALRNQTHPLDAILVVNNGCTDDTLRWLQLQKGLVIISQKNVGSGGGFNTGINWAYRQGYSWIWCMDDDGYPKEDALEKILEADTEILSLRNCAVLDKTDKKSFVWKTKNYNTIDEVNTKLIRGIGHPFNGTMLHRNIVEKVGLPQSRLFLWGDESEYYCRITRKYNIPVYTVTDSIHYHPASGFSFTHDWDYNNNWKMYYYVRNRFCINQSKFNNRLVAFLNYCFFLFAMMGVVLFFQKTNRVKKLGFLFWPFQDAITNDFSATPQAILSGLNTRRKLSNRYVLQNLFVNLWSALTSPSQVARPREAININ